MRIAILSDIHGNSLALEAVLDDIQARGSVDGYWILGDLCAIGYDPVGVMEQLHQLPNKIVIKGNADRYVCSLDLPPPTREDAINDNNKIEVLMEVAGNFSWTRGALDATGWTSWMQELPFDHKLPYPMVQAFCWYIPNQTQMKVKVSIPALKMMSLPDYCRMLMRNSSVSGIFICRCDVIFGISKS